MSDLPSTGLLPIWLQWLGMGQASPRSVMGSFTQVRDPLPGSSPDFPCALAGSWFEYGAAWLPAGAHIGW